MDIKRINLNLLVALDELLTERHVSRAAERLYLTQSATSHTLKQLRSLFNDALLVRSSNKMILTPLAKELLPQLKKVLDQLQAIVNLPEIFKPEISNRHFNIGMPDYIESDLLLPLLEYLERYAPSVTVSSIHYNRITKTTTFEEENIDLCVCFSDKELDNLSTETIFSDSVVCIARKKHPILKEKLTLHNYLKAKHITINDKEHPKVAYLDIDRILNLAGHKRHIAYSTNTILPILNSLAHTNYVVSLPQYIALKYPHLVFKSIPLNLPNIAFMQIWHPCRSNDMGLKWLRHVIKNIILNSAVPTYCERPVVSI